MDSDEMKMNNPKEYKMNGILFEITTDIVAQQ